MSSLMFKKQTKKEELYDELEKLNTQVENIDNFEPHCPMGIELFNTRLRKLRLKFEIINLKVSLVGGNNEHGVNSKAGN
jgi:hypothetical protein